MSLHKCMYYDATCENSATDLKMALSRRAVYENMSKTLTFGEQIVPDKNMFGK